jgi:O-antigen/teichoic acid export membrane protein
VALNSANSRIAKNTMALYIRMGITMLISFFTVRITLEVLGVEDYGLNNVVASVVSLFGFINGSLGTAVQRFFSIEIGKNNEEALSRIFSTGLYLHIVVALITLVIAEAFAFFYLSKLNIPEERLFAAHVVFQISVVSMVLNILNVPFAALLRAREDFTKTAILDIIRSFLQLGVLYLFYTIDFDKLIVFSVLNFCVSLIYLLSITFLACKYKEASFSIKRDYELIKIMLNFISMLLITVLSLIMNKQGVVILVNVFFGLTINSAYAIAFQVSTVMETFTMNFKQAVVPQLMVAYGANDRSRMDKLIYLGTKVTFMLMLFVSVPIIFEADYILALWLKEPPQHAAVFTSLVLIGLNINTFSYFVYQAVHASGKIKKQQLLTSISYIVSIASIFIAFKLGGSFIYAVYIPIIFAIVNNFIILKSAQTTIQFDLKYYLYQIIVRSLILSVILCLVMVFVISKLDVSLMRLILNFLICALIVIFGGYIVLLNKVERKTISNFIKRM